MGQVELTAYPVNKISFVLEKNYSIYFMSRADQIFHGEKIPIVFIFGTRIKQETRGFHVMQLALICRVDRQADRTLNIAFDRYLKKN